MESAKREETSGDAGTKLSPQALDVLRSLDSLSYGVLELHSNGRSSFNGGVRENSHMITRDLIKQGITHLRGSVAKLSYSPYSQAQVICQIAHLHLLLEEFTYAYSAYSQYRHLSLSSDSDPALFYALAIIHCHHRQFKHSEEAYKKVLSLAPSFPRSGEVHLQLALLLKRRKAYEEAAVHFDKAQNKHDPHLDKLLIQFHSAHMFELQGHSIQARENYEALLGSRTLSQHIKALTQKQLGWLLHKCAKAVKPGEEGVRERAVELLKQATQGMPECGETWYLLGRVLVTHQRCHEAFSAYQKSIRYPSKISPANTWHSIGHLYFQMQQPRDSLQAYLCCVYLDVHHLQCWKSLGCLYEAVVHPVEALLCYQNAMIAFAKKEVRVGKEIDYVCSRIDALNQYLSVLGGKPCVQNPGMPRLCEAWGTLVPDHIRRRQPNPGTPLLSLNQCNSQGIALPNQFASVTTLPSLPSYPPATLVSPTSLLGITGGGNVLAPMSSENENKFQLKNTAEKKPPAVKWSSGSTPSPPVHTPMSHSTSTTMLPHTFQNGNGNITGITAMECNHETATPSVPSTTATSASVDLNGINLDNLDFDALTAAANAIPSPAALAARSRVKVTSSTHSQTASTNTSSQGNPSVSLNTTPSSHTTSSPSVHPIGTPATHISQLSSLQAHPHSHPASTAAHPSSLIRSLSSPSPSIPYTLPSTSHSFLPSTEANKSVHGSFEVGHSNHLPLSSSQSPTCDTVSCVANSTRSLFQNTSSDSHTPDMTPSHYSSASTFNWPSYLMGAQQQQPSTNSSPTKPSDPMQLQPLTTPHPSTTNPTMSLASLPSMIVTDPMSSVQSLVSQTPLQPPVSVSHSPRRPLSLPVHKEKRRSSDKKSLPRKRRLSVNSSDPSKYSGSRRRSETNPSHLAPELAVPPLGAVKGGRARKKSCDGVLSPLAPLPPNMASNPALLSQIKAASHSAAPLSTDPFLSGLNSLAQWTAGAGLGSEGGATFGYNQMVPHMATKASGPSLVHNPVVPYPNTNINQSILPLATSSLCNPSGAMYPPSTTVTNGRMFGHKMTTMTNPQSGNCSQTIPFMTTVANPPGATSVNGHNQTPHSTITTMAKPPGYNQAPPHSTTTTTVANPSMDILFSVSGHNQTSPHSTTMANPLVLGSIPFAGHNQTTPNPTTTTPSDTMHSNTSHVSPFGSSHFPSSFVEQFVSKKGRVSPEKAQDTSTCSFNPFQLPMSHVPTVHTSQSPFYSNPTPITAHQNHPHKIRRCSDLGKTTKTVHHHSSTPFLPSATFAGLPLFSPPPPPQPQLPTADRHTPLITSPIPPLPPTPTATMTNLKEHVSQVSPTSGPSPNQRQLSPTSQQTWQHSVKMSHVVELVQPLQLPSQLPLAREQPQQTGLQAPQQHTMTSQMALCQIEQQSATVSLTNTSSTSHPSPEDGPTMTVLTSSASSDHKPANPPASNPPTYSNQPVTSVQSLVNQLFAVLQQKDGTAHVSTAEAMVHSPSDSSSGISSAGTTLSTFSAASTAESSPVDLLGSQFVTTHSLSQHSPSLVPSSLHSIQQPFLPSPHHPSPTSPMSPLHCPHASMKTRRPRLSSCGSSLMGDPDYTMQRETKEVETEPQLHHNHTDYQNNSKLCSLNDRRLDTTKYSLSKFVAPHVPFPSLASIKEYMILDPELRPPSPPPFQPGMELRPDCPIYEVTSYEDAASTKLHEFCNDPANPICIIRGLVEAIGLDLSLFSSRCLVETCSDHDMEVREQMKQAADENCDVVSGKQVWKCESSKSITTVNEYAEYQQKILQKELEEEQSGHVSDAGEKGEREFLSFGTNVDISDEKIWSEQMAELHKLPPFLRVTCPEANLLSHIGHTVLGMNSVQLYMKVAGSRTPGHQENNNFCSLNINIGPGNCEWFAVPNSYWGALHNLCEKHKVNFLVGSWWPVLDELYRHKIPVYRFTQYKGDVVYINPGTVHWVQANSTCNNIAWNTGTLTAHQFRMAWERYQWNKVQKVRSIVPMIHLTWNLARHITVTDSHFYSQVRSLLESSLAQTNLLLSHLKRAGIPVVWHGRLDGEPAPYCNNCVEEVFNILFVLSHRGEYLVYCHRCASSMRKTFTVLQQYQTEDLEEVVTSFRLHSPEL